MERRGRAVGGAAGGRKPLAGAAVEAGGGSALVQFKEEQ